VILGFTDHEDDGVAIESTAIVAVTAGHLRTPRVLDPSDHRDPLAVTIVHTLAGPLLVSQEPEEVVRRWREAGTAPVRAHAETVGWLSQYFHPSILRPDYPAAWDSKALTASKEVEP
jgi:hypothetical protein